MKFNQLKTLLWRNTILKRRHIFSTLLEVVIPTIIILIIAKFSEYEEQKIDIVPIKNLPSKPIDEIPLYNNIIECNFVFPAEFDGQKQNSFIENFKSNKLFSSSNQTNNNELNGINNENNQTNSTLDNELIETNNKNITNNKSKPQEEKVVKEPKKIEKRDEFKNTVKINILKNETELNAKYKTYLKDYENRDYNFYGIIFTSPTNYRIRFQTNNDLKKSLIRDYTIDDYEIDYFKNNGSFNEDEYFIIQAGIDNAIIKTLIPNSQNYHIMRRPLERDGYTLVKKINKIQSFIPLFMIFYFVPCICSLLNQLVIEKESKIKESLIIIGLRKSSFWISWSIIYAIIIVISSVLVTFAMRYFKLFIYVHWSVILVSLLIYGMSCCCIAFILSTLIKKSKTATTIGVMIIILFFAFYFISLILEKMPEAQLICNYTLSPIAYINLFNELINFESQRLPVSYKTLIFNKASKNCFIGLIVTTLAYLIIAIYLDNVLPQGNNFHRKWYFFITDLFRCCRPKKNKNIASNNNNNGNPFIQKDPEGLQKSVTIKDIGKSFKVKGEKIEILKSINFNAYYDEIFAILGHNGAGKTTLISIMTGIISSTHGEVYYDDVPITGNETEICKQFGYCPQFDTFNNSLTVSEHIKLFAGIKGIEIDIDPILRDIDLLNKKNNFPKELSGGQKRKLCITLALLGSPKYVFLDEPTTGLDPYSRKNIWELLSRKKKGCTMFVTTHYMDEADLLADRKMIISNGNITCLGTSLFLKNKFNMNYSIDIYYKEAKDCSMADGIIDYFCPGAAQSKSFTTTSVNNQSSDIKDEYITTYLLPMKHSNRFKDIFTGLNRYIKDNRNSMTNFSLTAPTLEELFIKLESNDNTDIIQKAKNTAAVNMNSDNEKLINKLDHVFGRTQLTKSSSLRQIWAISKLRLKIFLRNKTFAIIYTLIPLLLIIGMIFLMNYCIKKVSEPENYEPLEISPKLYEEVDWFKDLEASNGQGLDTINQINDKSISSFKTVNFEKELTVNSKKLTNDLKYIGGFSGISNNTQQGLEFTFYFNTTYTYATPIAINLINNAIIKQNNINEQISVTYDPFENYVQSLYDENDENKLFDLKTELVKVIFGPILIVVIALAVSLSISIFGPLTVKEREEGITHQIFLNGTKRINYWIGVLISDCICILIPIIFIGTIGAYNDLDIFNSKVIALTALFTILWIIASLLHQYIVCYYFKKYEKVSTLFIIINPILTLLIGIYALVISLLSSAALESEDKDLDGKLKSYQIACYFILFIFAPAAVVLFYSKLSIFIIFKKIDINESDIVKFMTSKQFTETMSRTDISDTEKQNIISNLFFGQRIPTLEELFKVENGFIYLIIGLVGVIILYCLILYLFEKSKLRHLKKNNEYTQERRSILNKKLENGPRDVYNEWKRVQFSLNGNKSQINNNIALKVYQLNKDFKMKLSEMVKRRKEEMKKNEISDESNSNSNSNNKDRKNKKANIKKTAFEKMDNRITFDKKHNVYINRIVDDVTFGVNNGECLGLLGPNGAGKTTSINMITGLMSHTHGAVVYGNKDLNVTDTADLSLGYCSQHDSLWKLLTVKETINFYLNICGYPSKDIPRYTKALIEACGIENHTNKKVSEISGGTKRKLSLIIAICSSPSYLILDEPSAGMDPFTRRYMWKLISELKEVRETATILTTHSTEEAEALCDRIAILIKGRLVCIDTPKSIKMNQSDKYVLEVFTDYPEQFENEIVKKNNLFGLIEGDETYELESTISYQKYTIKMKTENIARVFALMERAKENRLISQYNFGQYSLEQVFINFVNQTE
ncbi:hypothetical protein BCR32DRAFT_297520 [Anaeromyces robustus]|uniref:ABC transporter domain-containing protein n=1 Tax=Anaeromyces robustus TaxID=1754192 RepID=A0A1Y1W2L4_9FUNG|nr:hypothetical protein BCR32DRAFT_297520 [Anaeromyces robustus]|eukprot:ORX67728.1 hypothetical protein BCR32DRAFT_297520 [Anaeromyces robustus]